jgi:hypothetical protein
MVTALDGRAQCKEFAAGTVDPEVQMVYRETTCVAEAQMKKMLRRPFDLQNELPARWLVLRDAKVLRVYLVGHHIVVDGASMSLISKEFLELVADVDAVLPPLADFSQMHMVEVRLFFFFFFFFFPPLLPSRSSKAYIIRPHRMPGSAPSHMYKAATSSFHKCETRTTASGQQHRLWPNDHRGRIIARLTRGRPSPRRYVDPYSVLASGGH